jgi:GxxExxY protein
MDRFRRSDRGDVMHPLDKKADALTQEGVGAAMKVYRDKGPGLIESIDERGLLRELELRGIPAGSQKRGPLDDKGLVFQEPFRLDVVTEDGLLLELKAVEPFLPVHKAMLLAYMKRMNRPFGLIVIFNETILKNGIFRMILPGANRPSLSPSFPPYKN